MKKLGVKDYLLIILSVALVVVVCVWIFSSNSEEKALKMRIQQREEQIEILSQERDSLDQENQISKYLVERHKIKIDSLEFEISNRKPIIKYLKQSIKDEKAKIIVLPDSSKLDSMFTRLLPNG